MSALEATPNCSVKSVIITFKSTTVFPSFPNKASFVSKQGFFALQTRLLYDANKASFETHHATPEKRASLLLPPPYYILAAAQPFFNPPPAYRKAGDSMTQNRESRPVCRQQAPQACETAIRHQSITSVKIHCVRTQFI